MFCDRASGLLLSTPRKAFEQYCAKESVYLPPVFAAGQGLGALSVLAGRPQAKTPAHNWVPVSTQFQSWQRALQHK